MPQWIKKKALASKPEDLSSRPRTPHGGRVEPISSSCPLTFFNDKSSKIRKEKKRKGIKRESTDGPVFSRPMVYYVNLKPD